MISKTKRPGATLRSLLSGLVATMALAQSSLAATDYPIQSVQIIIDSAPGSAIDATARIIAEGLSRQWGQQALIINTPGAGGAIAAKLAARATPDGYTLYMPSFSAFIAEPGATKDLPIHVPKDFEAVGYLSGGPMFITAAPWLGVKTLAELVALAKEKPGELAYGTNGPGRLTNLTGELLQIHSGIKLLMIPYAAGGTSRVLADVMGKRIPLVFEAYSGLASAIQSGAVIPLAVGSAERLPDFPDLPTVAETYPGFEATGWQVLLAPIGTPKNTIAKANADLIKTLAEPDIVQRLRQVGRFTRPMSPAQLVAFIQAEQKKWEPVQKKALGESK